MRFPLGENDALVKGVGLMRSTTVTGEPFPRFGSYVSNSLSTMQQQSSRCPICMTSDTVPLHLVRQTCDYRMKFSSYLWRSRFLPAILFLLVNAHELVQLLETHFFGSHCRGSATRSVLSNAMRRSLISFFACSSTSA